MLTKNRAFKRLMTALFILFVSIQLLRSEVNAQSMSPGEVYRQASKAVVLIYGLQKDSGKQARGTGSIIQAGYVLTNAHVVLNESDRPHEKITIYQRPEKLEDDFKSNLTNGRSGQVVYFNKELDLAVIAVDGLSGAAVLSLGDSNKVAVGDMVYAIGHPENGGLWSLTSGRIGALIRNYNQIQGKDVLQTEASLNRGNSGGPLLNEQGQLVGVNTSIARQSKDGLVITGINFAVNANVAREWLKKSGIALPASVALVATVNPTKPMAALMEKTDVAPANIPLPSENLATSPAKPIIKPVAQSATNNNLPTKTGEFSKTKDSEQSNSELENELWTRPRPFQDKDLFEALSGSQKAEQELENEMDMLDKEILEKELLEKAKPKKS